MQTALPYAHLALITDLDGTLLMPDKTLHPADAAAIADFRAKGGRFSIATGRGAQATLPYCELLRPDFPVVLYNGAALYDADAGKYVFTAYLPEGITALLRDLMTRFPGVGAELLDENGVYVIQDGEYERRHLEITHVPLILRDLTEMNPARCMKALFAGAPEDVGRMLEYVQTADTAGMTVTRSHAWFLEILPAGISKGTAVHRLREMLPAGTVIGTSGDFDNDTAMLLEAEYCGAPCDAQESVQAAVRGKGGFVSARSCKDGFFADWIAAFTARCVK